MYVFILFSTIFSAPLMNTNSTLENSSAAIALTDLDDSGKYGGYPYPYPFY